jgi:hypothetical protein
MPVETVDITLSQDEALVLFEFLSRFVQDDDLHIADQSEEVVLADILCVLETRLVAPLDPNYQDLLASARRATRREELT